jgi:toxin FitB
VSGPLAVDTSVAIRLLHRSHPGHRAAVRWWAGRAIVLSGHAAIETYSVLTRLPGDARLAPEAASELMAARFGGAIDPVRHETARIPALFAEWGISGGAVYDGLVGLAAADHDAVLATCDVRARATYEAVGATTVVVPPA